MTRPRRLPVEDLFRKPERAAVRISPRGDRLAWLAPHDRRLNVHVQDLATGEVRRVTHAQERDVAGFLWVGDDRLLYGQDQGGDENDRLYAVSADGSEPVDLTPFEGVKSSIVDELEDVPGFVLIEMNRRDARVFDAFRLDVRTGALELVAENPGNVQTWVTDHAGRLRAAVTTDGVNTSVLYRATEQEPFSTVATYDFKESATPLGFTFDDARLLVSSNVGRDRRAVCTYDLERGVEAEELFAHPEVDVEQVLLSRRRRKVTGFAYHTDRLGYHFVDPLRERIQRAVEAAYPGADVALVSHTRDETRFVASISGDRQPGSYALVDAGTLTVSQLFDTRPWLREDDLAPMSALRFAARDGRSIPAYLTLPVGREARGLPLVLLVHGGPWARDVWGFQPEVQLFANRGAAVLQVNFRGSVGYGRDFFEAGFAQWGKSMQDDLTDGVRHLIGTGVVDASRVGIYGGSYGGYAALAGLTLTPGVYACGISYVGVSNLFTLIASIPPYWEPMLEMLYEMVGHPERDAERLRAISPVFHADRIRAPLFVIQGANDPRVKKAESDQIVEAVRARGLDVPYMVKDDEGHGFHNEENQFEVYEAIDAFLTRHLGLDTE